MTIPLSPLLDTIRTYNDQKLTDTGYDIDFYEPGNNQIYAVLCYRSRWAGDVDGVTYRTHDLPPDVLQALGRDVRGEPHNHYPDLLAAIQTWLHDTGADDWKIIRRGSRNG